MVWLFKSSTLFSVLFCSNRVNVALFQAPENSEEEKSYEVVSLRTVKGDEVKEIMSASQTENNEGIFNFKREVQQFFYCFVGKTIQTGISLYRFFKTSFFLEIF